MAFYVIIFSYQILRKERIMAKRYIVNLTCEEREELIGLTKKGKTGARKINRANILLLADEGETDTEIAEILRTGVSTVERTRRRFIEGGLGKATNDDPRNGAPRILNGRDEAVLIAEACSDPPDGRLRWTMRLLADRVVELGLADSISDETIRLILKNSEIRPWQKKRWCIPTVSPEYVFRTEDILDLYEEPYNPAFPCICFDEKPYQLVGEKMIPIPAVPGRPMRYDYEYERNGTANLFIIFEPAAGQRHIVVTQRRTKMDFANTMKLLADELCPDAEKIRVVMDNLNTHNPYALYERFEPEEARRILRRLEFHYTPKHASWLNMAEIEISVLCGQCLDRRIADKETLKKEISAWEKERNEKSAKVRWQFKNSDARIKLRRLYPS